MKTQMNKYPTSFQAVDNVIYNRETNSLLLVRKKVQSKFRFSGGFVDPEDKSLEEAALRERIEEVSIDLECTKPEYMFSFRVDDPRYRESEDKIMSAVFFNEHLFGSPKALDDLAGGEVKWFSIRELYDGYNEILMPEHIELMNGLMENARLFDFINKN